MSAIPKKKLCWNCEGNVSKEIDNCPYCGVYLHATEEESEESWNPSFQDERDGTQSTEDSDDVQPFTSEQLNRNSHNLSNNILPSSLFSQIKSEILPILLLMSGSIFFLFGVILLLFSQNGLLVLQWNGNNWLYFLLASIPALILGWKFFQDLE